MKWEKMFEEIRRSGAKLTEAEIRRRVDLVW